LKLSFFAVAIQPACFYCAPTTRPATRHFVVLVQRMARRVEAAVLHQQRYVQVAFLGRRVGHQLNFNCRKAPDAQPCRGAMP